MNKTVFPLVMAVLTACPVLFSCTENEQEVPVENKIYEYRFELAGDDTRAYLNDDGVFWELNDHVGLFTPTESLEAAVNTDASPKTIDVQSSTSLAVGTKVYAYYPYVEGNTSVSASKVLFPAEQSGGSVSAMPLAGIPAEVVTEGEYNGVIRFLNLGSVIDFRVFSSTHNNETVESISLKADAGNLAGTATIDLTGVDWDDETNTATIPNLTWADGAGSSTVTLTQTASVAVDKEAAAVGNLYMVVAPGTYSGTITVTTNAARYTFPFTNQTFKQNGLKRFNMNLDSDSAVREAFSKTYGYVSSISEGTYLICGSETNELSVALFPNVNTEGWSNDSNRQAIPHIIIGDDTSIQTITRDDAEVICSEVELIGAQGKFKIKSVKTGQYLMVPNSNYVIAFTEEESNATVFDINSNSVRSGSYYFYHSGSAHGFTFRNSSATNLRFYKLGGSTLSQTLEFSETEFTYDLASGEPFVEPTLTGAKTTVEFSSEPEAIATVNSSNGEVTFNANHKTGVVTIKATAIGMDGYASAEATYTITVTDSDKPVVTYYKASILESGYDYLIVSGGKAMKNTNGTLSDEAVTVSDGTIALADDSGLLWTAEAVTGNNYGTHTLANNAKFITRSSSSLTLGNEPSGSKNYVVWRYDGEYLWNGNSTNYYLYYNNNWALSQTNKPSTNTELFTARQPQTLSFTSGTAKYDLYLNDWIITVPTLNGAQTAVTYSPSDAMVATVDADGTVHPLSVGTTTITATAAGTAEYQGATATYELTVINSKAPKYVKADEWENGEEYLIVSNGYVLRNNSGSAAAVAVDVVDGQVSFDAESTDLWKATVDGTAFTLTNSSQYLRCTTSWGSTSVSLSIGTASSTASNNQWTYDATNEYLKVAGSYYLYYSTGNSKWSLSNSQSGTHVAALYKLDDGRLEQKLSFSAEEAEYDLGTSAWTKAVPTLSGAQTTVTYGSSDETVATVDNNGTVTPLKAGTVTITATAAADEQYKKATASYTLSVVNSAVVEKTYNRVSSITAGTYLIMGRETDEKRIGTYVCVFPPIADNKCDHIKVSDNKDLATLTTTSNEYGAYEVELIASGSNWLVKVKSSGQYMYYASSKISFTDDASVAAQQITSSNDGYPACIKNTNNDQFYHSGSNTCFMYSNKKNANNLRFFKLSE